MSFEVPQFCLEECPRVARIGRGDGRAATERTTSCPAFVGPYLEQLVDEQSASDSILGPETLETLNGLLTDAQAQAPACVERVKRGDEPVNIYKKM